MYRVFLLLAVLLITFLTIQDAGAQTLQGQVSDAATQEPLPGATLFVPSLQLGTATDQQGRYSMAFRRAGTYRVVVSFLGYQSESRTITLEESVVMLDVVLQHTALETPAITITAKALASDILSTPQSVAVVEGRALARHRGAAAFDALEQVAGVRLLRTGPGIAKPMIRGLTSQRVLVIQNGIRQEGQQWGDEHAPELDAFGIDRIEVVKGPASLLYGSEALGGVIQASSRDLFSYARPWTGRMTLQGLSNSRQGAANARLGGRRGETVYEGALTAKRAGSFETPVGLVPNTGLEELNGSLRLGQSFPWGTVLAEYQHYGARLGLFEPGEEIQGGDRFTINLPKQRVIHNRTKLNIKRKMETGSRLEWVTTWQQNKRKEFEEHYEEEEAVARILQAVASQAEEKAPALFLRLNTVTSDARFHHKPIGRVFGTIGVSGFFQDNQTLAEEALIPAAQTLNGSVYVFEEWVRPELTVSGGARFDARQLNVEDNDELNVPAQTRSYTAISSALGLAWQPRSGLSLALNAGRAWRAPALIELFGNGVHEGTIRFEQGDAALQPEHSFTYEATVRWLHPHIYLEATGFVNHIDDYIFPRRSNLVDPGSGFSIYIYQQARAKLWGGEARVDFHPHVIEWLHLHLNADVTQTLNQETDIPLPFSPAPRVGFELEIEQAHLGPVDDFGIQFGPTFTTRQTRIDSSETPTNAYTIWDVSMSGTLNAGNLTFTPLLAIDNLFNEAYTSHLSRFKPHGILNPAETSDSKC